MLLLAALLFQRSVPGTCCPSFADGDLATLLHLLTMQEQEPRPRATSFGSLRRPDDSEGLEMSPPKPNSSRYKTEMCRTFEETGYCKYGSKCQFAHGSQELRPIIRHPKYKTDLCRTFHVHGFCPYGPRCHFIHGENQSKLQEINELKERALRQHGLQSRSGDAYPRERSVSFGGISQRPVPRDRSSSFSSKPVTTGRSHSAASPASSHSPLSPSSHCLERKPASLDSAGSSPPSSPDPSPPRTSYLSVLLSATQASNAGVFQYPDPREAVARRPHDVTSSQNLQQLVWPLLTPANPGATQSQIPLQDVFSGLSREETIARLAMLLRTPSPTQNASPSMAPEPQPSTAASLAVCASPLDISRSLQLPDLKQLMGGLQI